MFSASINPNTAIILVCGGCGSHFQNGWHEFSRSHISTNNMDRKLIIVVMSMFSGPRNPNMAIILVCGGCGSHFQNGWHEFSRSHISANNNDRKLIIVSLSLFPGSKYQNMAIILCQRQSAIVFQYGCHILCTFITLYRCRTSRAIAVVGILEIVQSL